jgi:hypothetical protein
MVLAMALSSDHPRPGVGDRRQAQLFSVIPTGGALTGWLMLPCWE